MPDLAIPDVWSLLLATAVGYLMGALPLADRLSRRSGVDIFRTGTGLAGATNVMRMVAGFRLSSSSWATCRRA